MSLQQPAEQRGNGKRQRRENGRENMKTKDEIKKKLKEIESDERLKYLAATVFENAPLALIQTHLEATRTTLKWVLQ